AFFAYFFLIFSALRARFLSCSVSPINPGMNEYLYLDDDLDIDPEVDGLNQPVQVEYDGLVVRLKAHVFVKPGKSYHVKFVIADVNDDNLDSGLFIKESSVRVINPTP
ncbi:choice-of-anchor L domain-containing protein, partial [Roseibacillus ishigakijimensis]